MKKIFAVLAVLLLLPSCSSTPGPSELAREIQESFQSAQSVRFTAGVTADYGERLFDFGLSYVSAGDGGVITLSEPAIIAGVTVTISDGGATLGYEGAEVFTGEILPDGLSPVDAAPLLVKSWRTGLITEAVRESWNGEDCLAILYRVSDTVSLRTWFSQSAGLPLHAEVTFDGYTVLLWDFYNVIAE